MKNNANFFEYFETLSKSDKRTTAKQLKHLYNDALRDEQETLAEYRRCKRSSIKRQRYFEAVQRLGAVIDVFDILGIEYEQSEEL